MPSVCAVRLHITVNYIQILSAALQSSMVILCCELICCTVQFLKVLPKNVLHQMKLIKYEAISTKRVSGLATVIWLANHVLLVSHYVICGPSGYTTFFYV
jgi:hypothetical protein